LEEQPSDLKRQKKDLEEIWHEEEKEDFTKVEIYFFSCLP